MNFLDRHQWLFAALISLCVSVAVFLLFSVGRVEGLIEHGLLFDTDSYLHVVRLRDYLIHGPFQGQFSARDNVPFGLVMHWTLPFDAILLPILWPISAFGGDGAHVGGSAMVTVAGLSGPFFLTCLGFLSGWVARLLGGGRASVFAAAATGASIGLQGYATAGRVDHHILATAISMAAIGFALKCALAMPDAVRKRDYLVCGVTAGLAVWTSVEALYLVDVALALLAFPASVRARTMAPLAPIAAAAACAFAVLIDPTRAGAGSLDIDRVSPVFIVHFVIAGVVLVSWSAITARLSSWRCRSLAFAVLGIAAGAFWLWLFPNLLAGPDALLGRDLTQAWWNQIGQIKPIRDLADFFAFGATSALGVCGFVVAAVLTERRGCRVLLTVFGCASCGAFVLVAAHIRFTPYASAIGAVGLGLGAAAVGASSTRRALLVGVSAAFLPFAGLVLIMSTNPASSQVPSGGRCDLSVLTPLFSAPAPGSVPSARIMSEIDMAPEILYRANTTGTVAGPYQRNRSGLADAYAFFRSVGDDRTAKDIVVRRSIDYVVVCDYRVAAFDDGIANGEGLHQRLVKGVPPAWLKLVSLPSSVAGSGVLIYAPVSAEGAGR